MSLKDFEMGKELGKGAFGSVSIVKRIADNKMYAMKRVKISQLGTKERENALNEVRILASLKHANIIGYKEAFFDDESKTLNIVMEIADDGDLESKVQRHIKNKTNFSENELWTYLIQIISGLKYLHDSKIMHRDLKCANIFLLKNGTLKLGDLNVSKIVKMGLAHTQTGTPYYASPEVWQDKPYDYKSDIWSVACVMYELCTLKPPFRGNSLEQLFKNVTKGVYDPIPSIFSKDLISIVGMMLQTNPNNRPSCDQILNHEIVMKRAYLLKEGKDLKNEPQPIQLLNTIKLPRNISEINQRLPKNKRYKEEYEEANLMNYDVNINRKPQVVIEPERKLEPKEINMKRNNDYANQLNNVNRILNDQKINLNPPNNYNRPISANNPNPIQKDPRSEINSYNNNNNINNMYKKDNVASNRPISAKNDKINNLNPNLNQVMNPNIIAKPKTPVLLRNDNIGINGNNLNNIYNSNNNQVNPRSNINNVNNNILMRNNNVLNIINGNKDQGVKIIPSSDKSKVVVSSRPGSAKSSNPNPINDHKIRMNQINNIKDQLDRKNLVNERPASPKVGVPINKKPYISNSPKNKMPIPSGVNSRPVSGKDRIAMNNNPVVLRNDKNVIIEKINYDRAMINNRIDPKKVQVNNVINRGGINQSPMNRGIVNNQAGPRIVNINQRK